MTVDMKAVRAHTRGGPEVLDYEVAPRPSPGPQEVLIAVHAAAITFAELTWDETWTRNGEDRTPTIPSHEVAGVIAAVGEEVADLREGDEVYALIDFDRDGAAAEYVAIPASSAASRPQSLSYVEAAALPLAGLTAHQALVEHAAVRPGERVLVHGGAGGVGAFVVQLAVALGAEVSATCLAADVGFVRSLGAVHVIDVEHERFDDVEGHYDVVVDTVGGDTLARSFPVLKRGGRLVALPGPPSTELAERYDVTAIFFVVRPDRDALREIASLADGGRLRVTVAGTFPLAQARGAFESGQSLARQPGKTVLVVRD